MSDDAKSLKRMVAGSRETETAMTEGAVERARRLRALQEASASALEPNWDGYGAQPVSGHSVAWAGEMLQAIPESWPSPDIGVDPDGEISLEWSKGRYQIFSVSVSPNGLLHYAGLFGASKTQGVEAFLGQLPQPIVGNLVRLFAPQVWMAQTSRPR